MDKNKSFFFERTFIRSIIFLCFAQLLIPRYVLASTGWGYGWGKDIFIYWMIIPVLLIVGWLLIHVWNTNYSKLIIVIISLYDSFVIFYPLITIKGTVLYTLFPIIVFIFYGFNLIVKSFPRIKRLLIHLLFSFTTFIALLVIFEKLKQMNAVSHSSNGTLIF